MKKILKIIIGLLFAPVLLLVIFLGTLQFQALNADFLLGSLESNGAYEQIPKIVQSGVAASGSPDAPTEESQRLQEISNRVTPELSREIVETNVNNFTGFINGDTKDLNMYLPRSKLGIPDHPTDPRGQGDVIPMTALSPDGGLSVLHNSDELIRNLWLFFVVLLVGLAALYARLSVPWTKVYKLLLGSGISLVITSAAVLFVFESGKQDIMAPGKEPGQYMVGLLFNSILKDMLTTWLWVGSVLIVVSIVLIFVQKKFYKTPAGSKSTKRTYMRSKTV